MTKIEALDKLLDKLDGDMAWRKREMTVLKLQCEQNPMDIIAHKSAILLIYAHWEGFIKNAAKEYLEYLNSQSIKCANMRNCFIVLQMGKIIKEELSSKKFKHRQAMLNAISSASAQIFSVKAEKTISTDSNLSAEAFCTILDQLGIEKTNFELKFRLIDNILLSYRNPIAHGSRRKDEEIFSAAMQIKDQILDLLNEFRNQIFEAAEKDKHLKQPIIYSAQPIVYNMLQHITYCTKHTKYR